MDGRSGSGATQVPLDDRDHRAVLAAVSRLSRTDSDQTFGERTCREVHHLVPGVWTSYNRTSTVGARRTRASYFPTVDPAAHDERMAIFNRYAEQNPVVRHLCRSERVDHPVTLGETDPDGDFRRTRLFKSYYAPWGATTQAAVGLDAAPGLLTTLVVNRDEGGFSEREMALLGCLQVHLVALHHAYRCGVGSAAQSLAAATSWHHLLVSDHGVVLAADAGANSVSGAVGRELRVGAELAGSPLWQRVAPLLSVAASDDQGWHHAGLATDGLEVLLQRRPVGPNLLLLRDSAGSQAGAIRALGLTARQSEVAVAVAQGAGDSEIARRLGIAPGTARKHVEHIRVRLGVHNRAALAALVARAAAIPPSPGSLSQQS